MLVLTRKTGQRIMIGDQIEVAVLSVAGEKVRLGITAAKEIPIYRDEVYRRIRRAGAESAEPNPGSGEESVDEALEQLSSGSSE
jgi:carbon storage regulator